QRKLDDLKKHPEQHSIGISFHEEIEIIEKKIAETRKQIFFNLTPWQRVQLARHPKRPFTLDYLNKSFTDFNELHGDRLFAADRVLILENAYYSVISPEGCAAILWKDRAAAPKAAEALRITAKDLLELGLVDEIIPEPLGGAHNSLSETATTLKQALLKNLE